MSNINVETDMMQDRSEGDMSWKEYDLEHWTPRKDETFYYVGYNKKNTSVTDDNKYTPVVKEGIAVWETKPRMTAKYVFLQKEIVKGNCYKTKKEAENNLKKYND